MSNFPQIFGVEITKKFEFKPPPRFQASKDFQQFPQFTSVSPVFTVAA